MSEYWNMFFSSGPFIPHGHCYLWQTDLVLLHIISDALIALAYYSIPATLFYFVRKREDLPFHWIFLLFSGFIVACGTTHLMEIWTLWHPTYWLSGLIKALTATISLFTALQLVPLVPQALALPSPAQLEQANQKLQIQITERLSIEAQLRTYQNDLEQLVAARTNEITKTNEQLQLEIAERQRILEILRQSEERYRYLAEAIPQLVWTTNSQGECDYFNQKWYEYTGLTFEESLGSGWVTALHPDDVQNAYEVWINAVNSGTLYENEYRFKRASDDTYRWQLARGLPLKDEQGVVVKWFGTCTDIQEQKQIQQERAQLLELEQAARTKAETANRIKDEFLAILSHELRTPINTILGWSRLLQSGRLAPEKISPALETIERNAKLQTQLIEDLLDVSSILQGKLTLQTQSLHLESIVLSAIDTITLAAQTKSIQVNTIFVPNVGPVLGDSTRLQQVVWNLLSNAVKFTPPGGKVEVQLNQVDGYAQIIVSDTGKGINAEFLPYAFDYFRQADSSSTRKFGGLGLGLAIVRNIVEIHGGTVTAASPGNDLGATFTVCLPLIQDRNLALFNEQNNSLSLISNSLSLSGVQILLVEDDADSRDFLAFVLQQDGAEVISVSSALAALQVLEQTKPDVLISDIGMPEMDGYTLLRQIRARTAEAGGQIAAVSKAIPKAIALTAFASSQDKQQALQAGFQMHLSKPINPEELVAGIIKLMENRD
ncbi:MULTISPECIES: hybrid sensor histidine kinase/response regulator [unclassified Tolypothrix]|uniref:hybrid sensor histidine kinase/response regulator n=1 Tax=unclassified Tolypothrix TaxID=2649714 RepID=UPI0005EAC35A|nr:MULTISPECIES: ATP-binding protein [unclassified Tolypothrix]BAY90480.1 multi-sensor hybrid histidine kinase [Microchaete diplosiphon NIES-3275]EKF01099.1 sensor histidine kinase [Tolypothrix sp. PCC 7601]MBE9082204.1 response regulator [Tolypothrix sp. LEGE 11397]UYD24645.1 response regulator [Tolypothrix sp. PCC 7712]UYD33126.1 response regulator [Tolypothrix sp. PCC 7601]